jgi:hypothetical protein
MGHFLEVELAHLPSTPVEAEPDQSTNNWQGCNDKRPIDLLSDAQISCIYDSSNGKQGNEPNRGGCDQEPNVIRAFEDHHVCPVAFTCIEYVSLQLSGNPLKKGVNSHC